MSQTVYVVDDELAVCDGLAELLAANGFSVRTFTDAGAFLAEIDGDSSGCLVLDMSMPAMSGLELQAALKARGIELPIIFLTGHGDIPVTVRALKAGAVDFLEKPASAEVLLPRIAEAFALDAQQREEQAECLDARRRYAQLTVREREVMGLVIKGLSSKEIARQLEISHRTVEIHRANLMQKMDAASVPELVGLAAACGLPIR